MKNVLVVLALLVLGATGSAQTMQHVQPNMIDGSANPEQIPTNVILRLWLDLYTNGDQLRDFSNVGLNAADTAALSNIMNSYRSRLDALVGPYNAAVASETNNRNTFFQAVNALVDSNWAAIQQSLTPAGLTKFSAYLENQKAGAQVSTFDAGLGATAKRNLKEAQMVASMGPMPPQSGMTPAYSGYSSTSIVTPNAYDYFQRANGGLGSNWTTRYGSFAISGDAVVINSGGGSGGYDALAYDAAGGLGGDQCSTTVVGTPPTASGAFGPAIRISASAETYYSAYFYAGGPFIGLAKSVNGSASSLGTYSLSLNSGDVLTLCGMQTTLTVSVNGTKLFSATDSAITTGYPGIQGNNVANPGTISEWAGTTINGTIVYAEIEGDTVCAGGHCPAATHTPKITNTDGTYGGTSTGAGVPPAQYIGFEYNVSYPESDLVAGTKVTLSGGVQCSIIGTFFTWGVPDPEPSGLQMQLAYTMSTPTGGSPLAWTLTSHCTAVTTPPDYNPPIAYLQSAAAAYLGESLCLRTTAPKIPWICPIGADIPQPTLPPLYNCANWDAGHPGIILLGNYP